MWLGIETSSLVSSVALMDEHNLIGELTIQAGLTHSEQLVPHIDMLLRASQVDRNELKGIVVSIGPGSFTGLRIGMYPIQIIQFVPLLMHRRNMSMRAFINT